MSLPCDTSRVDCDTPKLPPPVLRLFVELRNRASETAHGAVVATRTDLAQTLGVSERTVCRARAHLVAAGLINVYGPDAARTGNTYQMLVS